MTDDGELPTPLAPLAHDAVGAARRLRQLTNRLDLLRERLHKDRIHHGIFGDQASAERVRQYDLQEQELTRETIEQVHRLRAAVDRVKP